MDEHTERQAVIAALFWTVFSSLLSVWRLGIKDISSPLEWAAIIAVMIGIGSSVALAGYFTNKVLQDLYGN